MLPITSIHEINELVDRIKINSRGMVTNFFASENRLNEWILRKELFVSIQDGTLWILRFDRGFYHLHYVSSSIDALQADIVALIADYGDKSFAVDVIGRENDIGPIAAIFKSYDFNDHLYLNRMKKIVKEPPKIGISKCPEAEFALSGDVEDVMNLLENSFDKYAEQLPDLVEINEAVEKKHILLVKKDGIIAGLLYFELTGFTSVLRYWFVNPDYRELKIGSKLMWHYFDICTSAKCFVLWVIVENENAIKRYIHYGYAMDYLMDQILVRKGK